ncbi:hypothetical protein LUX33_09780 [Actinomadura madurae]|uniref:hypothetical protein n=1 Tax=Actinomadura madurae TaxID=1993 RepID=UPI0020D1FB83|nr:hypothetical protein [Actinomadura madurae]MCP9948673.1 hypothetical protein [Actinomadura madurae]MCP9965444.1 hypothetical protein [Actinomadura madurae]
MRLRTGPRHPSASTPCRADNPGSPGQPSRIESLARAREPFQQESDARQAQAIGQEQDAGTPVADHGPPEPAAPDASQTTEQDPQATGKPDAEGPQPYHERTGENTEQPFGPREGGQEVTPGEPKAHERAAEPAGESERTPQIPDGEGTADGRTSQPQEVERPAEELGEHRTTDDAARPQEAAGRDQEAPERQGEQDPEHGRNTESAEAAASPNETNETNPEAPRYPKLSDVYVDSSGKVHVEPRYGREQTSNPGTELAPNEPETTDPAGLPPREDPTRAEAGTRGRGEFGSPENDPADRDPRKEDPENSSRRREFRRGVFDQPADAKKSVDTLADPIRKSFERVPPTGQHAGANKDTGQFKSPDHPLQAGSAVIAVAGAMIVAIEGVRRSKQIARRLIGRNHGNH